MKVSRTISNFPALAARAGIMVASASVCAALGWSAPCARADAKEFYFQRALRLSNPVAFDNPSAAGTFDQLIDHSTPTPPAAGAVEDMRTFKQRYWVNSSYARGPGSPVLYYICGEATCSANEMAGATLENAKALGAYAVTLEHRYYGLSQPFDTLSTDNLKYLTVANALADLAAFEKWAQANLGLTGKWIVIGGSYSGSLSAYYRTLYPDLVQGSLASSAPVQALENFEDYDKHVTDVAGPECANAMRQVVKAAEDAIDAEASDPSRFNMIKTDFAAQKIQEPDDFLYLIADVGASAVQYGMRDEFCNSLTQAAGPGAEASAATLQAYGAFAQKVYAMWGIDAWGFSSESAQSLNPNDYINGFGQRQWLYQSCTEFGYFQNAYHDPAESSRSQRINPAYHRGLCNRLFGLPLDHDPDIAGTNAAFYQPILEHGSNILLTNGSADPWSLLGITAANGNDTNPLLTVVLIDGGAHCDDLLPSSPSDSASLQAARQKFSDLAASWLGLASAPAGLLGRAGL